MKPLAIEQWRGTPRSRGTTGDQEALTHGMLRLRLLVFLPTVFAFLLVVRAIFGAFFLEPLVVRQLESKWPHWSVVQNLLRFSPILFGRSCAGSLERLASQDQWYARHAHMALSRMNHHKGAAAIDRRRLAHQPDSGWWEPPTPSPELIDLIGQDVSRDLTMSLPETAEEVEQLSLHFAAQHSCVIESGPGDLVVVFPHCFLGSSSDLWLYRSSDRISVFLGYLLTPRVRQRNVTMKCTFDGGLIGIEWEDNSPPPECGSTSPLPDPVTLDIYERLVDRDGDSLPDAVEQRLLLAPDSVDTDRDGLIDSQDPSPNGGWVPSPQSDEAAAVAIVETSWLMFSKTCKRKEVAFVASRQPIEWSRVCGPTVNVPLEAVDGQPDGSDLWSLYPAVSDSGKPDGFPWQEILSSHRGTWPEILRPAGRAFLFTNDHIGSDGEGLEFRVRFVNGSWMVVWEELLWL